MCQVSDMNQVPHSGPTDGWRHLTKFSRRSTWRAVFMCPLMSALRVEVCDVIFRAPLLQPPGHGRYVISLLLFIASRTR